MGSRVAEHAADSAVPLAGGGVSALIDSSPVEHNLIPQNIGAAAGQVDASPGSGNQIRHARHPSGRCPEVNADVGELVFCGVGADRCVGRS